LGCACRKHAGNQEGRDSDEASPQDRHFSLPLCDLIFLGEVLQASRALASSRLALRQLVPQNGIVATSELWFLQFEGI
jgi:hypothetical protein